MNVDLIFAEFGLERRTAGDAKLPEERLEPALCSFLRYLPAEWPVRVVLYTDQHECQRSENLIVHKVAPPFDKQHSRYGWRCNDYFKIFGLRESTADLAIATDADMLVVSPDVRAIAPLAERFGLLAPMNPRWLVRTDAASECDGSPADDESLGMGFAYNGAPWVKHAYADARYGRLLDCYLREMRERPCRGPVAMWRAAWRMSVYPYLLPPQWCVCSQNIDVPNPVIVHVGHEDVRRKFMKDAA